MANEIKNTAEQRQKMQKPPGTNDGDKVYIDFVLLLYMKKEDLKVEE
jgi:hypothetical protein